MSQAPEIDGEDYYSSLARRVYFIAEIEDWDYNKTVKMLNDKEQFEKYYEQVSEEDRSTVVCP